MPPWGGASPARPDGAVDRDGAIVMLELAGFSMAANRDGGFEIVAIALPGPGDDPPAVWYARQSADSGWARQSLGQPGSGSGDMPVGIAAAPNADGHLEAVALGYSSTVWHAWQTSPGGGWSSWSSLGNPAQGNPLTKPVLAQNKDGRLEMFTSLQGFAVWHRWQTAANNGWSAWKSLGNPVTTGGPLGAPAVAHNHDGRLEVFTLATGGALWHCWQTAANNGWSAWSSLGTPSTEPAYNPPTLTRSHDGRLAVFTIASDGAVWHRTQHQPGRGPWEPWAFLGPHPGTLTDLAAGVHADGRVVLFAIGHKPDGGTEIWQVEQSAPDGSWGTATRQLVSDPFGKTSVTLLGKTSGHATSPVLVSGSDGRLRLCSQVAGNDPGLLTFLYIRTQINPNGSEWDEELLNLQPA